MPAGQIRLASQALEAPDVDNLARVVDNPQVMWIPVCKARK